MATPNKAVRHASKITTSTIFPAKPTQEAQCPLSPFDLYLADIRYNQKVLFFQRQTDMSLHHEIIKRLKWSLAEVLVYFYPLAGRLTESPDGFLHVKCNDDGAQFTEVVADATLDELLLDNSARAIQELLFPLNDSICADGRSLPLLAVQVTQLKDAVALAFTLNHMLVDGYSTWHFINSWSQICRSGSVTIANPPFHNRFRADSRKKNDKYIQSLQGLQIRPQVSQLSHDLREAVFHFDKDTMTRLKNHVNALNKKTGIAVSYYKALAAHMWVAITRARKLRAEDETTLTLSIDCRSRLVPPLPTSYFGNAIYGQRITIRAGELLRNAGGIMFALNLLQETIETAQRDERIRLGIEEWMENPNLVFGQGVTNGIQIGSSPRFPVYESDFGFGRPVCVRSGAGNKCDGKITLFPGKEADGISVDAEICLSPSAMHILTSDPQFLLQLPHVEVNPI